MGGSLLQRGFMTYLQKSGAYLQVNPADSTRFCGYGSVTSAYDGDSVAYSFFICLASVFVYLGLVFFAVCQTSGTAYTAAHAGHAFDKGCLQVRSSRL